MPAKGFTGTKTQRAQLMAILSDWGHPSWLEKSKVDGKVSEVAMWVDRNHAQEKQNGGEN
jgi:hypothetical protein